MKDSDLKKYMKENNKEVLTHEDMLHLAINEYFKDKEKDKNY